MASAFSEAVKSPGLELELELELWDRMKPSLDDLGKQKVTPGRARDYMQEVGTTLGSSFFQTIAETRGRKCRH